MIISERESAIVGWILRPTPTPLFHMGRKNREGSNAVPTPAEPKVDENFG